MNEHEEKTSKVYLEAKIDDVEKLSDEWHEIFALGTCGERIIRPNPISRGEYYAKVVVQKTADFSPQMNATLDIPKSNKPRTSVRGEREGLFYNIRLKYVNPENYERSYSENIGPIKLDRKPKV